MNTGRRFWLALPLGLVVLSGCASMQRLTIDTDPVGAHVYLQRRGDVEVHGRVSGVFGSVDASSFEEEFIYLGTAPIDYEFRRRDTEVAIHSPEAGGDVTRHYREGVIRIEMDGYETVERLVRFSGSTILLMVPMQPRRSG
jgi:hypothetical protein